MTSAPSNAPQPGRLSQLWSAVTAVPSAMMKPVWYGVEKTQQLGSYTLARASEWKEDLVEGIQQKTAPLVAPIKTASAQVASIGGAVKSVWTADWKAWGQGLAATWTNKARTSVIAFKTDLNPLSPEPVDPNPMLKTMIKEAQVAEKYAYEEIGIAPKDVEDRKLPGVLLPLRIKPVAQEGPAQPSSPEIQIDLLEQQKKTDQQIDAFCKRLSDLSTLSVMQTIVFGENPDEKEKLALQLRQMVEAASTPDANGKTPSIWSLFTQRYPNLTFWQKVRTGLFYFWFYKVTSLIPNTVDTYLKTFINEIRTQLTDKNSVQNSGKFVKKIIDHADAFLDSYNQATQDYCEGKIPNFSLDDYRENTIADYYGGSLRLAEARKEWGVNETLNYIAEHLSDAEKADGPPSVALMQKKYLDRARMLLCKQFSRVIVETYSPHVELFKNWKTKTVGKFFSPLFEFIEWGLNKYLRYVMKTKILPSSLVGVIEKTIDATSPLNLPFTKELTSFLTRQITKLKDNLDKKSQDPAAPLPAPEGIENLGPAIQKLMLALNLHSINNKDALRKKFAEEGKSELDQMIQTKLEENIFAACRSLFQYFSQPGNAEEMFTELTNLANSAFSATEPMTAEQYVKYKQEFMDTDVRNLEDLSSEVFDKMTRSAVEEQVRGKDPLKAEKAVSAAFADMKDEAHEAFLQLRHLGQAMLKRIQDALLFPDSSFDIQKELASLAKVFETFLVRESLKNKLDGLEEVDRKSVRLALTPIFERVRPLGGKIHHLQKEHKDYSENNQIAYGITAMRRLLVNHEPEQRRRAILENLNQLAHRVPALKNRDRNHPEFAPQRAHINYLFRSLKDLIPSFGPASRQAGARTAALEMALNSLLDLAADPLESQKHLSPALVELDALRNVFKDAASIGLADSLEGSEKTFEEVQAYIAKIRAIAPKRPGVCEGFDKPIEKLQGDFKAYAQETRRQKNLESLPASIEDIAHYYQGKIQYLPPNFQLQVCVHRIAVSLDGLLKESSGLERESLLRLKEQVERLEQEILKKKSTPEQLKTAWNELHASLSEAFEKQRAKLKQCENDFRASFEFFGKLSEEAEKQYLQMKNDKQTSIRQGMESIVADLSLLVEEVQKLQKHPQHHLTPKQIGWVSTFLTGLGSLIGTAIGGWPVGSAISTFVGTTAITATQAKNLDKALNNHKAGFAAATVGTAAATSLAAATATWFNPWFAIPSFLVGAATTFKGGQAVSKEAVDTGQNKVLPAVENTFKQSYRFITESSRGHLFHAAITRLMKATIDSH